MSGYSGTGWGLGCGPIRAVVTRLLFKVAKRVSKMVAKKKTTSSTLILARRLTKAGYKTSHMIVQRHLFAYGHSN